MVQPDRVSILDQIPTVTTTSPQASTNLNTVPVTLQINGQTHSLQLDPRATLLDTLRESLGLTGTKKGCDHGQCGACTVLVNGERINSCLTLAVSYEGEAITTIEGLADGEDLHPVQAAFIQHDGFQCGYCTPGQIMSAVALMSELAAQRPSHVTPNVAAERIELTDVEIQERMSGNICRCGAYLGIVAAIRTAQALQDGSHHAQNNLQAQAMEEAA
jgi:xanthine dehydrogenase YagT iron-sulfur-binding subunit